MSLNDHVATMAAFRKRLSTLAEEIEEAKRHIQDSENEAVAIREQVEVERKRVLNQYRGGGGDDD
jgi:predicted  nucleic acid-binding Zn-ribbon protein